MIRTLRVTTRSTRSAESQRDEARAGARAGAEAAVKTERRARRARREIEAEARVRAEAGVQRRVTDTPEMLRRQQGPILLADRVELLLHHHHPRHQPLQLQQPHHHHMVTHIVIDAIDHVLDQDLDHHTLDEELRVRLRPKDIDTSNKRRTELPHRVLLFDFSLLTLTCTHAQFSVSLSFYDHLAATGLYSVQ